MSNVRPAGLSDDDDSDDDNFYYYEGDHTHAIQATHKARPKTNEEICYTAVKDGNLDEIRAMIERGFHIDHPLSGDWSPLMHACFLGSFPVTEFLIQEGANVNFNHNLSTPLMALCNSCSRNENELLLCLNLLMKSGADINATDRHATTALMNACRLGHIELVKKLVESHCDVNIQDTEGWSALFHAVNEGREDIVRVLIEGKARVDLIDRRKRSPYDLALTKGFDYLYTLVCSKKERRKLLENTENIAVIHSFSKDPIENLFALLPSETKSSVGFLPDVGKVLWAIDLKHLVKQFSVNNVNLGEFLLITDERLQELGVRFSVQRQRILNSIKRFHIHQWTKASLGMKPRNQQMDLDDGVKLMCNISKHLYILSATLSYVRVHQPVPIQPAVFDICDKNLHQITLIASELSSIKYHATYLKNKEKVEPTDLIHNKQKQRNNLFYISLVFSSIVIGFTLWKTKL